MLHINRYVTDYDKCMSSFKIWQGTWHILISYQMNRILMKTGLRAHYRNNMASQYQAIDTPQVNDRILSNKISHKPFHCKEGTSSWPYYMNITWKDGLCIETRSNCGLPYSLHRTFILVDYWLFNITTVGASKEFQNSCDHLWYRESVWIEMTWCNNAGNIYQHNTEMSA